MSEYKILIPEDIEREMRAMLEQRDALLEACQNVVDWFVLNEWLESSEQQAWLQEAIYKAGGSNE